MAPTQYVALDLPRAEHGRWRRDTSGALAVNLFSTGDLIHRGKAWKLATGNEDEQRAALDGYAADLSRFADVEPPPGLHLHVDRNARWAHVGAVVRATLKVLRVERVSWSVECGQRARPVCQEATVEPLGRLTPDLPVVEIHVRPAGDMAEEARLTVGSWSAVEMDDDGYGETDPWAADAGRLRELLGDARGIALRTYDESEGDETRHVAWRHVARVLDVLLDTEVREVELPGLGIRLHLLEPEDLRAGSQPFPDDPVATPVVVLLALLAVLAAFVATFAPLLLRRSARKRPRGS